MQRVNRSSAVVTLPAAPAGGTPGYFTGGNPGAGQPATVPGYEWFNGVQEELLAVILRGGITASNADLAQVRKSLDRLFGGGVATYSANATLTADDAGLVLVNAGSGAVTLTLPAAAAVNGRPLRLLLVRSDATTNTVTIQRAGSDLIDGAVSLLLPTRARMMLVSDGVSSWFWLDDAGLPVGAVFYIAATTAPPNAIKGNGALLSRTAFARLWAHAQASGNLVSDATWLAGGGPTMAYSTGNGSTTFRVPDLRGDFIRGWDDGRGVDAARAIGSWQADEIRSHTHGQVTNAFWVDGPGLFAVTAGGSTLNMNRQTATNAMGGTETRPRNGALLGCIRF
jgi:hypothetical protein